MAGELAALAQESAGSYSNPSFGFRLELPDGWIHREQDEGESLRLWLEPEDLSHHVQVLVRVNPPELVNDPRGAREQALDSIRGDQGFFDQETITAPIAERDALGVMVDSQGSGTHYRLRLLFLAEHDQLYFLQSIVLAGESDEWAAAIEAIWDSFAFIPLSEERRARKRLEGLAARSGSEVDWAETWEEAAELARASRKLILVMANMGTGFQMSDQAMTGSFMEQDVIELVQERYVPLRLWGGMQVPLEDSDRYGLGPSTSGSALMLVRPDGRVVREGGGMAHDLLLEGLTLDPDFPGPPAPTLETPLEQARLHLRRGELARAAAILAHPETACERRLRADLHRLQREGQEALGHLRAARESPGAEELAVDLDVDEAVILLRMARFAEAAALLERVVGEHSEHERIPEAVWWLGALHNRLGDPERAELVWNRLIASHPESRWAWMAAGSLTGTAFALGLGERLDWPAEELRAEWRRPVYAPLPSSEAARAAEDAIEYLLDHQRLDGTWIHPTELGQFTPDDPNPFILPTTAICALSLLPHRDRAEAEAAVDAALDWVLVECERGRTADEPRYFMDYTVWGHAYALWLLAECASEGLGEAGSLRGTAEGIVDALRAKQMPTGGWTYFNTRDVASDEHEVDQSESFVTAAVTLALLRSGEVGFEAQQEMIRKAVNCLARMSRGEGTFAYTLHHGREGAGRDLPRSEAAGRGPLCALALYRGGLGRLGSRQEIRFSLGTFLAHREQLGRERGKMLIHAGPDGQGSHYLLFDYATCAAAISELPEEERVGYREPLLEDLLRTRCEEGAFLDWPVMGRACGTGLALMALNELQIRR